MHTKPCSDLLLLVISVALALVVLITDLSLPPGVASGVFYVVVVLLSWWSPRRSVTMSIAAVCSGFTLLGFCFSPPDGPLWLAVGNRLIALFVIWIATVLLLQRKGMEETLRDNEERFRHLIEGSIQGILIHRHDKALFVNQAYAELHGYASPAEILAMDALTPLIAPHEQARLLGYRQCRLQGQDVPTHYEYQGIRKDGTSIWLENMVRVVSWEGKLALQSMIYDITERKQALERLAVRVKQMETVCVVSIDITRELDLTTLLRLIIQRAVALVGAAGGGTVFLWDETSQRLLPRAWHGVGKWIQQVRLGLGEGLTGRAAQQRTGIHVNHYQLSPYAVPGLAPHIGPLAILAEPLIYRGELLGVITLGNEGTGQLFAEQDHALLGLFAAQAAVAIGNARLFQAVQNQASQLTQANAALHTEVAERRRAEAAFRESEERYRAFVAHSSEGICRFEFTPPCRLLSQKTSKLRRFMRRAISPSVMM